MPTTVIAAQNLHKRYGSARVLSGVDFSAQSGQLVAVVGENGGGKSTLLRILAGAESMDEGRVQRSTAFGYCPQDSVLYPYLTPEEHFVLFGRGYGLSDAAVRASAEALFARFAFGEHRRRVVALLSGGTKQKLNLALAALHEPPLMLLDEPYNGFDAQAYERFLHYLDERKQRGGCIVVVAHLLHAHATFDRILHLREGQLHDERA